MMCAERAAADYPEPIVKTFIKKLLASSLLVMSFACGGQLDSADDAQDMKAPISFEPFTTYGASKEHAERYAKNCAAVGLTGTAARDLKTYDWRWTFQCDARVYVTVSAGPSSVRVLSHETRAYFMGMGTFDPVRVNVSAIDLLQLLVKTAVAQPQSMSLSAPLTQRMEPRWTVSASSKTLTVNAATGDVNG